MKNLLKKFSTWPVPSQIFLTSLLIQLVCIFLWLFISLIYIEYSMHLGGCDDALCGIALIFWGLIFLAFVLLISFSISMYKSVRLLKKYKYSNIGWYCLLAVVTNILFIFPVWWAASIQMNLAYIFLLLGMPAILASSYILFSFFRNLKF